MNKSELPPDSKPESEPKATSDINRELTVNNQENVDKTPKEHEYGLETTDGKFIEGGVFEKYLETHNAYEAYRYFNIKNTKEPIKPVALSKAVDSKELFGASVALDVRRTAIEGIMAFFNLQNKNRGARSKEGQKNIEWSHSDADSLYMNMDEKEKVASEDYKEHLETLAAVDKLRKAGFSENDIQSEKDLLRAELEHYYGPGNAYARDREKLVKKVQPPEFKRNTKK